MLALDQLGSFKTLIGADKLTNQEAQETLITQTKKMILRPLLNHFSGVLLDSDYGLLAYQQVIAEEKISNPPPFLLRIEETGYAKSYHGERLTRLKYRAKELKKQGARGVKLLLYLNPFAKTFPQQVNTALEVQEQARQQKMVFFLEILLYATPQNRITPEALPLTLQELLKHHVKPDVWKLPFPGSEKLALEITRILNPTPWVLLSHGTVFERFKKQLQICVASGAQGFLAGRALWQEVGHYRGKEQENFLSVTLPLRFEALAQVVAKHGSPNP